MRSFEYTSPASVGEAIALLERDDKGAVRLLAGGTDVITLMKAEIATPEQLINVKQLDGLTAGIEETSDGVTIGALTTLSMIEKSGLLHERYTALAEAASLAATPQLRNMATIGGNLLQRPRCWYFRDPLFNCWLKGGDECYAKDGQNQHHALFGAGPCVAVHPSDLAPALMALGATVRLQGPQGERTVPLEQFYALPLVDRRRETTLSDDEIVLSVQLPKTNDGMRSSYFKAMDRKAWAFALVGVAVALRIEGGNIAETRIVLSGVAPIPWRAQQAEAALQGVAPSAAAFAAAADAGLAEAQPLEHNGYKVPLLRSLIVRALETVTGA